MNQATQILAVLKDKFNELMSAPVPPAPEAPIEPTFEIKKLKDGTEISATSFDPGGVATVAGAPAPTGEHVLEDGTTLIIGEGGVISEVREIETIEDPAMEDMSKKLDTVTMAVDELKAQFAAQTKLNELQSKVDAQTLAIEKQKEVIKELFEAMQVLAETPTAAPDKAIPTPNNFKADAPKTDWSALAKQII